MLKMNRFLIAGLTLLLASCNGFFEKDNTPLPTALYPITAEVSPRFLWSTSAGGGVGDEYLKMSPAMSSIGIFTSSINGTVTAISKIDGRLLWQKNLHNAQLTTGIAASDGFASQPFVVVASRKGEVFALRQMDGALLWKINLPDELLAKPAISQGHVIIKAIDGHLYALSALNGRIIWSYQQVEPTLILQAASTPLVQDNALIVGFASGDLSKFSLRDGELLWQQRIAVAEGAFAIQRMIDIDADPLIIGGHLYAATYQGKIALMDWRTGKLRWSQPISSYTGMTGDQQAVYISDAEGNVSAFNASSGGLLWKQTGLKNRIISPPALMQNYVVVGDAEGYVHWLNKHNGQLAGRVLLSPALYAAPLVEDNRIYLFTNQGRLAAYYIK